MNVFCLRTDCKYNGCHLLTSGITQCFATLIKISDTKKCLTFEKKKGIK